MYNSFRVTIRLNYQRAEHVLKHYNVSIRLVAMETCDWCWILDIDYCLYRRCASTAAITSLRAITGRCTSVLGRICFRLSPLKSGLSVTIHNSQTTGPAVYYNLPGFFTDNASGTKLVAKSIFINDFYLLTSCTREHNKDLIIKAKTRTKNAKFVLKVTEGRSIKAGQERLSHIMRTGIYQLWRWRMT